MKIYRYTSACIFGAHGETDYVWSIYIRGEDKEKALLWGHEVAAKYDELHRLQPNKERIDKNIIEEQGIIEEVKENTLEASSTICTVGEIPIFSKKEK